MSQILILYSSLEGQTIKIAEKIAADLRQEANDVAVKAIDEQIELRGYDGLLIGASIHMGKYEPQVKSYITAHMETLYTMPTAFFSVCLSAVEDDEAKQQEAVDYIQELSFETGWQPEIAETFAGAVKYSKYGFLKRWLMKRIARAAHLGTDTGFDYEYTSWHAVTDFAARFAKLVRETQRATAMYAA